MKKSIISALTTALVVGAASTTFAASNPFEDVPADHWAYDAIAQLAADGVIEGYGDGTYRGDQEITRYEMAQMIARAMAKGGNGADKALIDKLAAEFADELNNLGVRVAALEKKVDNVRWKGWVGYENYTMINGEGGGFADRREVHQYVQLQLNPTFTINKNWIARARLKYYSDMNSASNTTGRLPKFSDGTQADDSGFFMDRAWVQGKYGNVTIQLGKIYHDSPFDISEGGNGGMVLGNRVSGGIITVGNKLKASLGIGRFSRDANMNRPNTTDSIQFLELSYNASKKLNIGAAYYHTSNEEAYKHAAANHAAVPGTGGRFWRDASFAYNKDFGSKDRHIAGIGLTYKFDNKWLANLAYARSNGAWQMKYRQAYSIEFGYNGGRYPDMSKRGNFGAFLAYRHLGKGAIIAPCYDGINWSGVSVRGFEIGAAYVFDKNILGTVLYSKGKYLNDSDIDAQQFYGALQFYF
ncbi:MAG: S-layer homology domain-containing protein [Fibrobacter sp.]|nr:S-layer homology domain-containing protein [Fibrobacter sp.]